MSGRSQPIVIPIMEQHCSIYKLQVCALLQMLVPELDQNAVGVKTEPVDGTKLVSLLNQVLEANKPDGPASSDMTSEPDVKHDMRLSQHVPTPHTHVTTPQVHATPHHQVTEPHMQVNSHERAAIPQTHIPSLQTHVPSSQTHIPSSQTHVPSQQKHIPSSQTHVSSQQTHVSSQEHVMAISQHDTSSQIDVTTQNGDNSAVKAEIYSTSVFHS